MKEIEEMLAASGIAPTPVRKLVYRCFENSVGPLSLSDLETLLDSVDKSTISRTLNTFREHDLLHSFTDGSSSVKYELCHSKNHGEHDDQHVHFRCEKCGETKCLQDVKIPDVMLPDGFLRHEVTYVITGICDACSKTNR